MLPHRTLPVLYDGTHTINSLIYVFILPKTRVYVNSFRHFKNDRKWLFERYQTVIFCRFLFVTQLPLRGVK